MPVPVAPATRPWRFIADEGIRTVASGCGRAVDDAGPQLERGPSNAYPARISSMADGSGVLLARSREQSSPTPGSFPSSGTTAYSGGVIFKAVGDAARIPTTGRRRGVVVRAATARAARRARHDQARRSTSDAPAEDSTFYGDLFAHVVEFEGTLYLEDGLHRALRAALQQRPILHARVLSL